MSKSDSLTVAQRKALLMQQQNAAAPAPASSFSKQPPSPANKFSSNPAPPPATQPHPTSTTINNPAPMTVSAPYQSISAPYPQLPANRFATVVPKAAGAPPTPATATAAAAPAAASPATTASTAAPPANPIVVTAHSSNHASSNRFQTMLPVDSRLAIPPSSATAIAPDAARIYTGLNVGEPDGRKKYWTALLEKLPAAERASSRDLSDLDDVDDTFLIELDLELEAGHFSSFVPALSSEDLSAVRKILISEARIHERTKIGVGYAQLCARLYLTAERDSNRCLDVLVWLSKIIKPYDHDAPYYSLIRNDLLKLNEKLWNNPRTIQLMNHFNSIGFDMVDLSDVLSTWFSGVFASSFFPSEITLRSIDIIFSQGNAEQIWGVLLGLLSVTQLQLQSCSTTEILFTTLQDLPATLTKAQVNEIFAQAYWNYVAVNPQALTSANKNLIPGFGANANSNQTVVGDLEWNKLIVSVSGPIKFQSAAMIKASSQANTATTNAAATLSTSTSTPTASTQSTTSVSTPHALASPASSTISPTAGALSGPGVVHHAHSATMTFNLSEFGDGNSRRSSAVQSGTSGNSTGAIMSPSTPAGALSPSVVAPPAAATDLTKRGSVANASGAAAGTLHDATLLNDLMNATSGNKSAAQLQALLTRAMDELKLQQSRSNHAAAPSSSSAAAASSSVSVNQSEAAQHVRSLSSSYAGIAPLEVQPLDRSSGGSSQRKMVPPSGLIKYSELLDYQLFPTLQMCGYLMKSRAPSKLFKRRGSSGFFGNLHRRFFVLQGSFLTYFKHHQDTKPTRDECIDLRICVATKIKNHEFAPFCFQISQKQSGALVYLLFASNETVRDVWLECLALATQTPVIYPAGSA